MGMRHLAVAEMFDAINRHANKEIEMDFDKEMDEMQAAIIRDARKMYSEKVVQHWLHPQNIGIMKDPHAEGKIKGPCGDTMGFFLKVDGNKIVDIKFITDGCCTTIASGNATAELAKGKSIQEALKISQQTVLDALDGLPEENAHCALLASNTLHETINNYMHRNRQGS